MAGMSQSYPVTPSVIPTSTQTRSPGVAPILRCTRVNGGGQRWLGDTPSDCFQPASQWVPSRPSQHGSWVEELHPFPCLHVGGPQTWAVGRLQTDTGLHLPSPFGWNLGPAQFPRMGGSLSGVSGPPYCVCRGAGGRRSAVGRTFVAGAPVVLK